MKMMFLGLFFLLAAMVVADRNDDQDVEPHLMHVFISRFNNPSVSGPVPYRFTRGRRVVDSRWDQITGENAGSTDLSYFKAYYSEYEEGKRKTGILSSETYGGFTKEIHVCRGSTQVPGVSSGVRTWILTPRECHSNKGWSEDFSFFVSDEPREGTTRLHYGVCQNSATGMLYGRVALDDRVCDEGHEEKMTDHFYAFPGNRLCEPLDIPLNGYISGTQLSGGVVSGRSFRCHSGYDLVGAETVTCDSTGHWRQEPPTCQAIDCGPPPEVEHGDLTGSDFHYRERVSYNCEEGYKLYPYMASRECLDNGQWTEDEILCQPVECGFPGDIPNGDVEGATYTYGSVVTFVCDDVYAVHGHISATCGADGRWSHPAPTCKKIGCRPLVQPQHGFLIGSDFSAGRDIIVRCHTGYSLIGSAILKCDQDGDLGVWDGGPPVCERIVCSRPEAPENGVVLGLDYSYGAQVTFTCDPGYVLRGAERATCMETGWDSDPPTCEVVTCREPGTPQHGSRDGDSLHYGSRIKFSCYEGYYIQGSDSIYCQDTGLWTAQIPTCQAIECPHLAAPLNGAKEAESLEFGTTASFTCFPGYELIGAESIGCQASGTWTADIPTCKACAVGYYKEGGGVDMCQSCPEYSSTSTTASFSSQLCMCVPGSHGPPGGPCKAVKCVALEAPSNGSIISCGLNNQDECFFSCQPGFFLQGSRVRRCTHYGWTGSHTICAECPANSYKEHEGSNTCMPCARNSGTGRVLGLSRQSCLCLPGFQGPPGGPCEDVDECSHDNGGCNHDCYNAPGSFYCRCNIPGYHLGADMRTCYMNETCTSLEQSPDNGYLRCAYTEMTNGHICHIKCNASYFFVSGVNNYITCGSETDFSWSHQMVNRTARIAACTKEFFVDVLLPITLQYRSLLSCNEFPIDSILLKNHLEESVQNLNVCRSMCQVRNLNLTCSELTQTEDGDAENMNSDILVSFDVLVKNPKENSISPRCEAPCKRKNMRQMLRDTFKLKSAVQMLVQQDPQKLELPEQDATEVVQGGFTNGRPQMLCDPGRVLSRMRLCVPCDKGYYLPERQLETCLPCPKGAYQELQGQTFCKDCLLGTTTLAEGSSHPVDCGVRVAEIFVNVTAPPEYEDYGDEEYEYDDEQINFGVY